MVLRFIDKDFVLGFWGSKGYWSKSDNKDYSWADAKAFCKNLGNGYILPDIYKVFHNLGLGFTISGINKYQQHYPKSSMIHGQINVFAGLSSKAISLIAWVKLLVLNPKCFSAFELSTLI